MTTRPPRLGDTIDDHCTRCRLLMNHAVVGMVGEEIKKVRCLTCRTEHSYRRGKAGRRSNDAVSSLFDQVLRGRPASGPATPVSPATPSETGEKKDESE
jgi:hypothetical protein